VLSNKLTRQAFKHGTHYQAAVPVNDKSLSHLGKKKKKKKKRRVLNRKDIEFNEED